ncbi:MAG: MATE family efflux transporter [Oscillospiraceae bacterium]|nr:MATE family efflux transporter [Oscillospiraceae bacterium]
MGLKQQFTAIDMTEGTPWKKLGLFALPLLVGNLFQQLYSTVDAIMLGNFVGDYALAAVGVTIPAHFLIMVLMMGIALGAGVMVSQYFGAGRREELSRTIGNCITLTAIAGVLIMVIGLLFSRTLLVFLGVPPEILDDAVVYMNVLLWGILGLAYFNIFSGILRGVGDAFSPLLYLAIASVLNIILNFILIAGLDWGVMGAALGTVISQALTSLLCLRRLRQMRDRFDIGLSYLRPQKKYVYQLLKLGVPTGVSQGAFAVAMMAVQPLANSFGPLFLAANVIVMRVDGFVMMPNFSFGNAMSVYAGQNMGAGKVERISKGTKQCTLLAFGTAFVLMIIILLFGRQIAGLFTQTEEVLDMSIQFLRILAVGYLTFSVNMVLWGAMRGAGDAMTPMWASLINTIVIRVPVAYLLVYIMGRPVALMYSLLIAWVFNTMLALIAYRIGRWRTKGIVKQEADAGGG